MKVTVTFKQENHEFKKDYAKQYHGGKESENNWRYLLHEGFTIPKIEKVFIEDGEFNLNGKKAGIEFNFLIPRVKLLKGIGEGKEVLLAVISQDLIQKIHAPFNEKYNTLRYYFYFKKETDLIPVDGHLYILKRDFPKELLADE